MLAITGLVMVYFTGFTSRFGAEPVVSHMAVAAPLEAQANAAVAAVPGSQLKEFIAPARPGQPHWFVVQLDGGARAVAVDPASTEVLAVVDKDNSLFAWAEKIHGTLLLGDVGDRLIEVAAGLGIVMVVTGFYLGWPRHTSWRQVLVPRWGRGGRNGWKSLHVGLGWWMGLVLVLFLLSGHTWTGVWGAKLVQAWGTFPAEKWDNVPQSTADTHASLNGQGPKAVPWTLEQTPMPLSGSQVGAVGVPAGQPVNLTTVTALARAMGFDQRFHVQLPAHELGVFTVSADTMSGDLNNPTRDRTVHVDRYTGRVLVDVGFGDYAPVAKAMAVGVALHQGNLGLWNAVLNVLFCLAIILACVSGVVMWWRRRPADAGRLGAPNPPAIPTRWWGGAVVMLVTALAFPLAGAVLVGALLLDWAVISRVAALRQRLG